MKRFIFLSAMFILASTAFGQTFTDTASINQFVRDTIKDRRPEKVTAAQIQKAFFGTVKVAQTQLDNYKSSVPKYLDTLYRSGDSLTFVKNAIPYSILAAPAPVNSNTYAPGGTQIFELASNAFTAGLTPGVVKSGAAATATFAAVGSYDQITVGGTGDGTSIFDFQGKQSCVSPIAVTMRVKIDSLGAAPTLGIFLHDLPNGTFSNWTGFDYKGYCNLLNGHWNIPTYSRAPVYDSVNSFNGTPLNAGDIVEVIYTHNYLDYENISIKVNGVLFKQSYVNIKVTQGDGGGADNHYTLGFVMGSGKYTLLKYEVRTPVANPILAITGDSLGTGARINVSESIIGWFNVISPYKGILCGGPSAYLAGATASLDEIYRLRPKYVYCSLWLDGAWQLFADPGNANYATFNAAFHQYVAAIKASGAKPILGMLTSSNLVLSAANMVIFNNYILTQFPNELKLDLRGMTFGYDGTNFHWNNATNKIVAQKLYDVIKADGGIK